MYFDPQYLVKRQDQEKQEHKGVLSWKIECRSLSILEPLIN